MIPAHEEDLRQYPSCGTPLCGVCRRCHLLGYMSDDPFLIDDETIPARCAAWVRAYRTLVAVQRRMEKEWQP